MIATSNPILEFLKQVPVFTGLPEDTLLKLAKGFKPLRYPVGRMLANAKIMPTHILLIYKGQVRVLGFDPRKEVPVTLELLEPGQFIGALSVLRNLSCETAIASSETGCLSLPIGDFLSLLEEEPSVARYFHTQPSVIEVFDILSRQLVQTADGATDLKALTLESWSKSVVQRLSKRSLDFLDPDYYWYVSGSQNTAEIGQLVTDASIGGLSIPVRLVGLPPSVPTAPLLMMESVATLDLPWNDVPVAPDLPSISSLNAPTKYPFFAGKGPVDAPLACFQMLAKYYNIPFRKDAVQRILTTQTQRSGDLTLAGYGAIVESMGIRAQLVQGTDTIFTKLPTPALVIWKQQLVILYRITPKQVVLAIPGYGLIRKKPSEILAEWEESFSLLLLDSTPYTPQKKFNLGWFATAVKDHRGALVEVFITSMFVQIFGLANPLITQLIIDKVLIQNSVGTLNVFGILLVGISFFEALLTCFRTYLFVDTTNRIDMTLGTQVIDHLFRLPLRYFEKRPVGELTTRVNELENIRQFLTGTALTVGLDAIFSVVYIAVMICYSWLLTLVALATVPLFGLLTLIVSPIIRQQSRAKAECNAETQSYLVEVLSGIQTVKAQNIELKSRWQWQERYSRFVSAGFNSVITSTTAGATSNFLNKLSSLVLLWVGAFLVLQGQLTLGELIAFRIIAGYTTSPLLRLIQLWQNFQETALSLERLADILDYPQEVSESDKSNIPLPPIEGAVRYEKISFAFKENGPLQLENVSLDVAPGTFVGVVGQSGSGKSTLVKLLMRLYEPKSGQILIDNFDVNKIELYSLREQIGMVLQDSLLFDGTVQENIALTRPDATSEEIIEAARVAFAHDFIMQLPQGYNTRVGERGSALSGGQRQRVAIARTILQDPRLLILDEATSALDALAERQVSENLSKKFAYRTVFFITHRLKSLQNADLILMMDQGKIVEQGTHDELMAFRGTYYCLYQQQELQS